MKITFILADYFNAEMAVMHLNATKPISRRTVTIELDSKQMSKLKLRRLGSSNGTDRYEEITECFIESEIKEEK